MSSGPVHTPQNILTQSIEAAAAANAAGPRRAPVGLPMGAPTVRSADLGTVQEGLPPLTPDEKAELDAKAAMLGINPDGTIGGQPVDEDGLLFGGHYGSEEDVAETVAVAQTQRIPASQPNITRPPRGAMTFKLTPVLPDFKAIESVSFLDHHMHVGGMMFPMTPEFESKMKRLVLEAVVAEVQARLTLALAAEVPDAGTAEGGATPSV